MHCLISNFGTASFLSNSAYSELYPSCLHHHSILYSVRITAVTVVDAIMATSYCSEGVLRMQYY